jgi:hypothetical protein
MTQVDRYYDNTRIQEFRACPRKFYFRHIRDWSHGGFSPPLLFGSSWHAAMDTLWPVFAEGDNSQNMTTEDLAQVGFLGFMQEWEDGNGPDVSEMAIDEVKFLEPRTPMIALEMLYAYIDERRSLFQRDSFELLAVEQPFAVPLDPDDETLFYVGRLDKVISLGGDIIVVEHKTSSLYKKNGPFRSTFTDSFSPNSQIDGYLHAAHMLYGEKAKAIWIDGALVHKTIHDGFAIIPIERQLSQLDAWLWECRSWIDNIEGNWAALDAKDNVHDAKYMAAFPKNTSACQDFARNCPYIDLCKMWSNPSTRMDTPPGFDKEHWSPFDRLNLDKLGLENKGA